MNNPMFISGDYDTTFIDKVLRRIEYKKKNHEIAALAAAIGKILKEEKAEVSHAKKEIGMSPWKLAGRPMRYQKGR